MFKFCEKGASIGVVPLRVVCGIIFLANGAPKLANMGGTIEAFQGMGIPSFITVLVAVFETLGGIALILGAFTRVAAVACAIVMVGAIIKIHWHNGFFLKNHGYEYNLALIAMCTCLFFSGAGRWSVDNVLERLKETKLKRHSYEERPD